MGMWLLGCLFLCLFWWIDVLVIVLVSVFDLRMKLMWMFLLCGNFRCW